MAEIFAVPFVTCGSMFVTLKIKVDVINSSEWKSILNIMCVNSFFFYFGSLVGRSYLPVSGDYERKDMTSGLEAGLGVQPKA